jgi:oxygen-dependent protoporphyrinogen oxidase
VTLAGGLGGLVDALVACLPPAALRASVRADGIRRSGGGLSVALAGGEQLEADAVLLAVPSASAASLVREFDRELATALGGIEFGSAATVHVAWPDAAGTRRTPSLGLFVPRTAGLELVAATFVSAKYPERSPAGIFLVRAFLGGAARHEISGRPEIELTESAVRELSQLLEISDEPLWTRLVLHRDALPQPAPGHLERVARLRARLAETPGLELAGGPLGAYGLPDTIAAAEAAAERLLAPRGSA